MFSLSPPRSSSRADGCVPLVCVTMMNTHAATAQATSATGAHIIRTAIGARSVIFFVSEGVRASSLPLREEKWRSWRLMHRMS